MLEYRYRIKMNNEVQNVIELESTTNDFDERAIWKNDHTLEVQYLKSWPIESYPDSDRIRGELIAWKNTGGR